MGSTSVGRAFAHHARGARFEPQLLYKASKLYTPAILAARRKGELKIIPTSLVSLRPP